VSQSPARASTLSRAPAVGLSDQVLPASGGTASLLTAILRCPHHLAPATASGPRKEDALPRWWPLSWRWFVRA